MNKTKLSEEAWEKLYEERCRRMQFFMSDPRARSLRSWMVPQAALLILRSFHHTRFGVVRYVVKDWLKNEWGEFKVWLWFFWHRTLLRKSRDELERLIDTDAGLTEEEAKL